MRKRVMYKETKKINKEQQTFSQANITQYANSPKSTNHQNQKLTTKTTQT